MASNSDLEELTSRYKETLSQDDVESLARQYLDACREKNEPIKRAILSEVGERDELAHNDFLTSCELVGAIHKAERFILSTFLKNGPGVIDRKRSCKKRSKPVVRTAKDFVKQRYKPLTPLVGQWLTKSSTVMIHATRGAGKSNLAIHLGACLATGVQFFDFAQPGFSTDIEPAKVLYLDGELQGERLQSMVVDSFLRLERRPDENEHFMLMPYADQNHLPNISIESDRKILSDVIEEHNPEIIFIDSICTFARSEADQNTEKFWAGIQEWLGELRKAGKTVILLHHDNKSGRQRGTSAKEDTLDTIIHLTLPDDYEADEGLRANMAFTKHRSRDCSSLYPRSIKLNSNTNQWEFEAAENQYEHQVIKLLQTSGKTQQQIASLVGIEQYQVSRIKKRAKERGLTIP